MIKVSILDEFGTTYSFETDDHQYALQVIDQWLKCDPFIEITIHPV